ncbi:hypothetical protein LIER_20065 [Lithospermum erythrorhizon]|uniref:CCHC-type domain-containing protein n=1 Tax=Lithospermum erythrorhizon TaxID=34254 RepID=A0AAV3QL74_LITER
MDRNYATEIRERITHSLLGIILDSEYFTCSPGPLSTSMEQSSFVTGHPISASKIRVFPLWIFGCKSMGFRLKALGKIIFEEWLGPLKKSLVVYNNANEAQPLEFIRVKIRIPTSSPLVPGTYISSLDRHPIWVSFRYEKIFKACYQCGRIGHSILHCRISRTWALNNFLESLYYNNQDHNIDFHADVERPLFDH